MPGKKGFTSKAQQGKIFAMEGRGEVAKGTGKRMAAETKDMKKLPEKADTAKALARAKAMKAAKK